MLISKTARKYVLNTQYALNNEIDHTSKTAAPLWYMYMTAYLAGKKKLIALHVDLMFTVESPRSVAMTNIGSCLDENRCM